MQTPENGNVVLYVSAMTSFVALMGVIVTGFVQWSASREARQERKEAREEARQAATVQQKTTDNIEHLVNSKSDAQAAIIKELTAKVDGLQAKLLSRAEAAPAVGGVPVQATTPPVMPVKIMEQEGPVDVKVVKKDA